MKKFLKTCLVMILFIHCMRAEGQYFVSVVGNIGGFVGYPCFVKLRNGKEISAASWAVIWGKYQFKTDKGEKIRLKPSMISSIAFDVSKGRIYVWALTNESREAILKNKELAQKDSFIFENIEGYGLYQLLNPKLSDKVRVYAYGVGLAGLSEGNSEANNGVLKYLIIRDNSKPFIADVSNYRQVLKEVFSDCPEMLSGFFDEEMRWDDIARHIYMYLKLCK
jgi:hypothetical protein